MLGRELSGSSSVEKSNNNKVSYRLTKIQAGGIEGGVKTYQLIWGGLTVISSHRKRSKVGWCWIADNRTSRSLGRLWSTILEILCLSGTASDTQAFFQSHSS